jgi:hypothetical protein
MLACGALVWMAYSLLQLRVNGVILDETVVPAQIIAGTSIRPVTRIASIIPPCSGCPTISGSPIKLFPDPLALSAIRNVISLFLSAYVPFVFAVLLTGKPKFGCFTTAVSVYRSNGR